MAKRFLGVVLAFLMGCPTTSFAQEDVFASVRGEIAGARLRIVLDGDREIQATLRRIDTDSILIGDVRSGRRPLPLRRPEGGEQGTFIVQQDEVRSATLLRHGPVQIRETSAGPSAAERVRTLGLGTRVRVWSTSGEAVEGTLSMLGTDAFGIRAGGGQKVIAYGDVRRLDDATSKAGRNVLIVAGVAAVGLAVFFAMVIQGLSHLGEV